MEKVKTLRLAEAKARADMAYALLEQAKQILDDVQVLGGQLMADFSAAEEAFDGIRNMTSLMFGASVKEP